MALGKDMYEGFSRFFEKPSRDTLRDLLKYGSGESDRFDFKESWPEKAKIAKHILALANSGGGALIIGVKDDGDLAASGIAQGQKVDKTDIVKQVTSYIPANLKFDIFDFDYPGDSEYTQIKGKSFQVVIVECEDSDLPYLCCKGHTDLKDNVVYVRKRKESTEADHDDLQEVLNRRLKTGYSSSGLLTLKEDLEQLRILYREMDNFRRYGITQLLSENMLNGFLSGQRSAKYPKQSLEDFVAEMIEHKKQKIKRTIGV